MNIDDSSKTATMKIPLEELNLGENYRMLQPESFSEEVSAFVSAVNWQEDRWIWGIFAAEAVLLLLVLRFRRANYFQFATIVIALLLVFSTRVVNEYLMEHWRLFSTQAYFDESGLFVAVIFSVPMCLIAVVAVSHMEDWRPLAMLLETNRDRNTQGVKKSESKQRLANLLISASSMMVTVKSQQIRRRRRTAQRQSSSDGGAGQSGETAERPISAHTKKEQ